MTYNIASDINTRKIVWYNNETKYMGSCVQIAKYNRQLSKYLTSKRPL